MTEAPAAFARSFDRLVAGTLAAAAAEVPALSERLAAVKLVPSDLTDVASLDRIPALSKDELMGMQAAAPPFAGLLAPAAAVRRVFQSPGPIYEPELEEADPWRWTPALRAAGFSADDVVLNAFGYHLSPAGAMFEQAAMAIGATVVPAGIGSLDLQARACRDLGVTGFVGLPSYLKALLEKGEELGLEPASWPLRRAFVSAEPLPASLRAWLLERVGTVRQGYGTAEAGNLGYECEAMDGLHVPNDALVQVCDLTTGQALWDGQEGEVVVTLFSRSYPLVRLGTGDLSAFLTRPCECGTPTPRLAGWLGRVGEAVKVRGMFLHPRQARAALEGLDGISGFQFVIERIDHLDVLRCDVVAEEGSGTERLHDAVKQRIRSGLRFNADVQFVPALDGDSVIVDRREWDGPGGETPAAGGAREQID
jgi:phenylacetate-CoA ligase